MDGLIQAFIKGQKIHPRSLWPSWSMCLGHQRKPHSNREKDTHGEEREKGLDSNFNQRLHMHPATATATAPPDALHAQRRLYAVRPQDHLFHVLNYFWVKQMFPTF